MCGSWDSTPDIGKDISILLATDCPFVLYIYVFVFGILPFCTVLYLTTHQHNDSIRGFGCYQYAQVQLLLILLFTDLASINILATCVSKQVLFKLPIIAADVCLVPYVCGCMLVHHMSFIAFPQQYSGLSYLWPEVVLEQLLYNRRQQETDWEEWGNQATTLFCDDEYDEQIDHDGDTEPLLQEWLAEQQRLGQMEDEDTGDGAELAISEYSIVNPEIDSWFVNDDSGYESDDSWLVAVADPSLWPAAISD